MPTLDKLPLTDTKARVLLIGESKAGKTHWAMQAAEAGFNVLYLDGDNSKATLNGLSAQAKPRVRYLDCHDSLTVPRFKIILMGLLESAEFQWNDSQQKMIAATQPLSEGETAWIIEPVKLTENDVVVIDSWSSLTWSIIWDWANGAGIQLSANLRNDNRNMYGDIGNKATWILNVLAALPCHLIVTAHPDEFVKYKKPPGRVSNQKEKDLELLWTRDIPKSTSRPHGRSMAKFFPDVLWLKIDIMGNRLIDGRAAEDRDGGSRFNGVQDANNIYSFEKLVQTIGGQAPNPDAPMPAVIEYEPGEYQAQPATAEPGVLSATVESVAPVNSIMGLIPKK